MAGCWAAAMGGCGGGVSGEHLVSVVAFKTTSDQVRDELVKLKVTVRQADGTTFVTSLGNLVAKNLCRSHNERLSPLDAAAGKLAEAMLEHSRLARVRASNPAFWWPTRSFPLSWGLIERWVLKTAVTNLERFGLPIGFDSTVASRPSRELIEMIYGERPLSGAFGTWGGAAIGDELGPGGTEFSFDHWDRGGRYFGGFLFRFRGLKLVANLDSEPPPNPIPEAFGDWAGTQLLRPLRVVQFPYRNK